MSNNFLLHLSLISGFGPAVAEKIVVALQAQKIPADTWDTLTAQEILHYCRLTGKATHALIEGLQDTSMLDKELALIEKHQVKWVTVLDSAYPEALKHTHLPPLILYYFGADLNSYKNVLAIVGAREATDYGYDAVQSLVPDLVRVGCTIVSGGAIGIDSKAHRATIDAGGKTIAVIGSGLLNPYPARNKALFNDIVRSGGAVVSPFPLTFGVFTGNFPARNRIISGLSRGCLVVQAAEQSGALITARYALEQGRDVGAIPGAFNDPMSAGCHILIKDGALCVTSVTDALQLAGLDPELALAEPRQQNLFSNETKQMCHPGLGSGSSSIKDPLVMLCAKPISFDELLVSTGMEPSILQGKLFDLQLEGALEQNFMGLWAQP